MPIYTLNGIMPQLPADGDYYIAPGAHVIGRVIMGRRASVWFGAVVRGDNEPITIGENSNVQDGVILHTDMGYPLDIGSGVTIGHRAMLHGCTVETGALIGIGATVLNGAVIGEGAIIGAHALVPEGRTIPPRAVVMGTPGRVVKSMTAAEAGKLTAIAERYVEHQSHYRAGLSEAVPGDT